MKKIIRFVKVAPVLSLCIVAMVFYILLQVVISFTSEGRWKVDKDGITHFVLKDGTNASKQFIQYLGKTYYVDENGKKVVSTWIDDGKRFLSISGDLVKDGFGDENDGLNGLYLFDKDGYVCKSGVYHVKGNDIYVQDDGRVPTNTFIRIPEDNIYVYVGNKGDIYKGKGLTNINGKTYYIESDGNIPKDQWYDVDENTRLYLDIDGSVVKNGWVLDTYYLDKNGKMLKDATAPDGSYVDKEGKIRFINHIKDKVENLGVGDTFTFGKYRYNRNDEPLEWMILEKDDTRAFLITKYVIETDTYNNQYIESSWEDSDIRLYLNRDLKNKIFNMNDIQLLDDFTLHNEGNYMYNIPRENDTKDKVFILSKEEHREYFGVADFSTGFNEKGAAEPTPYVKEKGIYMGDAGKWYEKYCNYWLRNPGYDKFHNMACMFTGNLDLNGFPNVSQKLGIRPCIVINYTKESEINE